MLTLWYLYEGRQPKLHNWKVYRREEGELGNWAARITVNEASAEYLCNRNFWCGRVYARPWIFRDQARARLPQNNSQCPTMLCLILKGQVGNS